MIGERPGRFCLHRQQIGMLAESRDFAAPLGRAAIEQGLGQRDPHLDIVGLSIKRNRKMRDPGWKIAKPATRNPGQVTQIDRVADIQQRTLSMTPGQRIIAAADCFEDRD